MELPFVNTTPEFELEYKQALGFVDVDIPYIKLKPDLKLAANELISLIGETTYEALITNYKKKKEGEEGATSPYQDEELKEAFQYALAAFSYMLFAPSNDLAHTSNGRRMRSSDDEKTPFEWMITNSDDVLQKRAYKAFDSLLKYMDANFDAWKASDEFKITHKLFVRTLEDFSAAYVIDSRLLLLKMVPGLNQAEQREIAPRLTSGLSATLKDKIIYKASGETSDTSKAITEDEALLIDLIKEASAYYALYWAIPRLQINMFPDGIVQMVRGDRATIKGRTIPAVPIIDQISKLFKADADNALINIENQIKVMFPPEVIEQTEAESNEDLYGFAEDDNFIST
jgi:hypothetical protein